MSLLFALTLLTAQAAEPELPIELTQALQAELERSLEELALPNAPPLYHLRYHLVRMNQISLSSAWGSPFAERQAPWHGLGIELRVGSPDFDNTGFGGWQTGFTRLSLPRVLTPSALRVDAWRATDQAYKQAVEQFARKEAQFIPPPDYPGDYLLTGAVVADEGGEELGDTEALRALTLELSAQMVGQGRVLDRGEVHLGHEAGWVWTVDSEGTSVRYPVLETTLRAVASVRADDGMVLHDQRLWTVASPEDLPEPEVMKREITTLRQQLQDLADRPTLDDEYVGPVLFEDAAAADLFRYLLLPQIEGTPPPVPFDSWLGEIGQTRDPVRMSRRVLPLGWSASDDPQRLPDHPGAYTHDHEGTPAQRVQIIEDGIVQALLMSRVPRKGVERSTGHGRGQLGSRAEGRASLTEVLPARRISSSRMRKRALKIARSYGRDWVLVVRRLQDPATLRAPGSSVFTLDSSASPSLPSPVAVSRLYADGREELLRGARFAQVERWILRDILAAGPQVQLDYLAPPDGSYAHMGPTSGMPAWISAPEVLIGEMELVPDSGKPSAVPVLPPPEPPG